MNVTIELNVTIEVYKYFWSINYFSEIRRDIKLLKKEKNSN